MGLDAGRSAGEGCDDRDRRIEREGSEGVGAGAAPQPQFESPAGILIGYARCSTEKQGLSAQPQRSQGVVEPGPGAVGAGEAGAEGDPLLGDPKPTEHLTLR